MAIVDFLVRIVDCIDVYCAIAVVDFSSIARMAVAREIGGTDVQTVLGESKMAQSSTSPSSR